jgi:hypothetical protein
MQLNPEVLATLKFLVQLVGLSVLITGSLVTPFKPVIAAKASKVAYPLIVQGLSVAFGVGSMIGLFALFSTGSIDGRSLGIAGLLGLAIGYAASGHYDFLTALLKVASQQTAAPADAAAAMGSESQASTDVPAPVAASQAPVSPAV